MRNMNQLASRWNCGSATPKLWLCRKSSQSFQWAAVPVPASNANTAATTSRRSGA